jgi:hypothetical protein
MFEMKVELRHLCVFLRLGILVAAAYVIVQYEGDGDAAFDCSAAAGAFVYGSSVVLAAYVTKIWIWDDVERVQISTTAATMWLNTNTAGLASIAIFKHAPLVMIAAFAIVGLTAGCAGCVSVFAQTFSAGWQFHGRELLELNSHHMFALLVTCVAFFAGAYGLLQLKHFDAIGVPSGQLKNSNALGSLPGVDHDHVYVMLYSIGIGFALLTVCSVACLSRVAKPMLFSSELCGNDDIIHDSGLALEPQVLVPDPGRESSIV